MWFAFNVSVPVSAPWMKVFTNLKRDKESYYNYNYLTFPAKQFLFFQKFNAAMVVHYFHFFKFPYILLFQVLPSKFSSDVKSMQFSSLGFFVACNFDGDFEIYGCTRWTWNNYYCCTRMSFETSRASPSPVSIWGFKLVVDPGFPRGCAKPIFWQTFTENSMEIGPGMGD